MVKINGKDNKEQTPIHLENNDNKTCQFFFAFFFVADDRQICRESFHCLRGCAV